MTDLNTNPQVGCIHAALQSLGPEARQVLLVCLSAIPLTDVSMERLLGALDDPPVPASERRCEPLRGEILPTLAGLLTDLSGEHANQRLALLSPVSAWLVPRKHGPVQIPGGDAFRRAALRFLRECPETIELGWKLLERGRAERRAILAGSKRYYGLLPAALQAGATLLLLAGVDAATLKVDRPGGIEGLDLGNLLGGVFRMLPETLDGPELLELPPVLQAPVLYRHTLLLSQYPHPRLISLIAAGQHLLGLPTEAGGLDKLQAQALRKLQLDHWLASGVDALPPRIGECSPANDLTYRDLQSLISGSVTTTPVELVQLVLREHTRRTQQREALLPGLCSVLQVLALTAEGGVTHLGTLNKLLRSNTDTLQIRLAHTLVEAEIAGQPPHLEQLLRPGMSIDVASLYVLAVLHHWAGIPLSVHLQALVRKLLPELDALGWFWMANGLRRALGEATDGRPGPHDWRRITAPWERTLTALSRFAGVQTATVDNASYSRLRVEINNAYGHHAAMLDTVTLEVRERTPSANGGHTPGRMFQSHKAAEVARRLAPDDNAARTFLQVWARTDAYAGIPAGSPIIIALVGMDDVQFNLRGSGPQAVQVLIERPSLEMDRGSHGQVILKLLPPPSNNGSYLKHDPDKATLTLVHYDEETLTLAAALGKQSELPASALPKLAALAPSLQRKLPLVNRAGINARRIAPLDTRLHVQVAPLPTGLRFQLRTRPLGSGGVFCPPGQGSAELYGLLEGEPVLVERDLAGEQRALDQLCVELPLLAGTGVLEPLDLTDPEQALELLEQLQQRGGDAADGLPLHWPAKPVQLTAVRSAQGLRLKLGSQRDWLSAEGDLLLDDGEVVDLARLLDALPSSHGRFVQLGGERVLALSQRLARQLRQLKLLREGSGSSVKLPWLAAATLEPLLAESGEVQSSAPFRERIGRLREAMALDPPLPGGFGADLRDYQREGVRWLLRLAHWAPGACLADDMGLGKTVQALAVLQARAALGPQLVIAPTSVVGNWQREAARFTPALEVRIYSAGDRSATLAALGPGSLLLLSYGLLALDIDALKAAAFATVVYDEAQALKNAQTLRAQAARQLQADFSIATTGTPIENHLGELWSLFRIVAPGLLGSQEQFSRRFATPIASDATASAKATLRALIAPFILRRNKHEVLDELPSRTEVVLRVEADAEEARLQQALRKQALDRLRDDSEDENRRRFNILAALMRLRRAACHPALVAPELGLPGSKLGQLLDLIEELREGKHRALVFSQFTDFLALVRQALDARKVRYQYLDGQTPPKARQQAVDAFQRGEGDLFLLSLKAGGVGLNLTAADYVIHLDPWWNPAIEQQATDRAHRIGQTRPVTVYKLVLAGSIEEQILSLHGSKRELVDAMLAEQDGGSRLGVDELLGLLRGVGE